MSATLHAFNELKEIRTELEICPFSYRAQAELRALLASKTKVIKETELRKSSLEQLEKQLDEFIAVSMVYHLFG